MDGRMPMQSLSLEMDQFKSMSARRKGSRKGAILLVEKAAGMKYVVLKARFYTKELHEYRANC
jgi:hypothetical protein